MFLFGCSGEKKQDLSVDTAPKESVKETAAEPPTQAAANEADSEAGQKLMFAKSNLDMAQKGILSYSQTVAICRGIIKDYPGTEYEQQARMLLREVPEDLRPQYNLSDEELGL
jgi:hypothetical protein